MYVTRYLWDSAVRRFFLYPFYLHHGSPKHQKIGQIGKIFSRAIIWAQFCSNTLEDTLVISWSMWSGFGQIQQFGICTFTISIYLMNHPNIKNSFTVGKIFSRAIVGESECWLLDVSVRLGRWSTYPARDFFQNKV